MRSIFTPFLLNFGAEEASRKSVEENDKCFLGDRTFKDRKCRTIVENSQQDREDDHNVVVE